LRADAPCEEKCNNQLNFSLNATTHQDILDGLSHKLLNWIQLLRVVSSVFRFINRFLSRVIASHINSSSFQISLKKQGRTL